MPLYEYRCRSTRCFRPEGAFTIRAKVEERDNQRCPACGERLERKMSVPHAAPIPGIPNIVNRHWNENGKPIDVRKTDEFIDGATKTGT